MVLRLFGNPLLKGMPARGNRDTVKHHESGMRKSVPNPAGPDFRELPHLAHLDPDEFDELSEALRAANAKYRRNGENGVDPRAHVPKKRTRFPGQHATCWYCGRQYVWGGNGITANLMCNGAREWACWNSIGFNGALAAEKVVDAIRCELEKIDGVAEQYAAMFESTDLNEKKAA
jgi:hypothetical protein